MKNRLIKDSSTPVFLGMPSNLAKRRSTIGSSIIRTASKTGGKIPYKSLSMVFPSSNDILTEMIPTTSFGNLQIHARKGAF